MLIGLMVGLAVAVCGGLGVRRIAATVAAQQGLKKQIRAAAKLITLADGVRGCVLAVCLYFAARLLLMHHYSVAFTPTRGMLLLFFASSPKRVGVLRHEG